MKRWDLESLVVRPHSPEVLESGEAGRVIVLELPAGESLSEHQVHECAWVLVLRGEVEITAGDERAVGGVSQLVQLIPGERHAVAARVDARLLLLLTPWPGEGHPGTMPLAERATVRQRAAEHRSRR